MVILKEACKTILLKHINTCQVKKRTMVSRGTLLQKNLEYNALCKMIHAHHQYLKKSDENLETFLDFCLKTYPLNPKIFQHFLEVTYPKRLYSLIEVRKIFPEIKISESNDSLFIDNSLLITTLQGSILKLNDFFKPGTLITTNPPATFSNSNKIYEKIAVAQTNQRYPDYIYYFSDKNESFRYYDLKTGTLEINKGHVISVSDNGTYNMLVEYLLLQQFKLYGNKPEIRVFLKSLMENKTLSPSESNKLLQNFYYENLYKYKDINPSMVFKHDLAYETATMSVPKSIEGAIKATAISSKQDTEELIVSTMKVAGTKVIKSYLDQGTKNPNITKALQEMLQESINYLKQNS